MSQSTQLIHAMAPQTRVCITAACCQDTVAKFSTGIVYIRGRGEMPLKQVDSREEKTQALKKYFVLHRQKSNI